VNRKYYILIDIIYVCSKVREMNTKTMVKKLEEKGYTMEEIIGNWKAHEKYGVEYPDWLQMMKEVVEQIPVKDW